MWLRACSGSTGCTVAGNATPWSWPELSPPEVDCQPVSFGARPGRWRERGGLKVRVLRPLGRLHRPPPQPVTPLLVYTHHFRSVPTRVAVVTARARGWVRR